MYSMPSARNRASIPLFSKESRHGKTGVVKHATNNLCFFRYPKTKLLEIYAVRELASLLPVSESGVIINTVSPGLCYSDLDRNAPL